MSGIAFHKTMLDFALALVGLISAFRHRVKILYFYYWQILGILYRSFPLKSRSFPQ